MDPQRHKVVRRLATIFLVFAIGDAPAEAAGLWLNEILFNPAGPDLPLEYVEIRGQPNAVLDTYTCLVGVEGDAGGNPGTIQNVFDLSGQRIGGNGFLVLLPKDSPLTPPAGASVLRHQGKGDGWGSGHSSDVGHTGEADQVEIENPSVTFFLIQAPEAPEPGQDIDADDDGHPDGSLFGEWTVLDSVGVLDADGDGDVAYGAVNFRRLDWPGNTARAAGIVLSVPFTPGYFARRAHSSFPNANDWVASDHPQGQPPGWTVGLPADTWPAPYADLPLDSPGGPNFDGPPVPGVLLEGTDGRITIDEGGAGESYSLALNTVPTGTVHIEVAPPPGVLAAEGQGPFLAPLVVAFTDTTPRTIRLQAADDRVLGFRIRRGRVTHRVIASEDPAAYPPEETLIPQIELKVREDEFLLLNEFVRGVGSGELSPPAYVELRGTPEARIEAAWLAVVEGDPAGAGTLLAAWELDGLRLGADGLCVLAAPGFQPLAESQTVVTEDPRLAAASSAFSGEARALLLLQTTSPLIEGRDYDAGDNGVLEQLPEDTVWLDSVGWESDEVSDAVRFAEVTLRLDGQAPEAALRRPGDDRAGKSSAWLAGTLQPDGSGGWLFDPAASDPEIPPGTRPTPGAPNNLAPVFAGLTAISGVIGDPTNPPLHFRIEDPEGRFDPATLQAHSDNPEVVPDEGLRWQSDGAGGWLLQIEPVGVGRATIELTVGDGVSTGFARVPYAASDPGRPGGIWLLGASDGSTAIPVDADWMWVADDEDEIIRLYSRHASGFPVQAVDFTEFLDLRDIENGDPREVDIEASTRLGKRLFWIGSHSHANIGESRTNRSRLFATDLVGSGPEATLHYLGRYDYLKQDLVAWDHENRHGLGADYFGLAASVAEDVLPKALDGSGWSIEGLAMMPGSTNGAYVAFRAPLVPPDSRAYALIVPVLNFAQLALSNGSPGSAVFGDPIQLDLYGRGIRSLEGDAEGYLIIAGPPGPTPTRYPNDFRLYTWSGLPGDPPQERAADLTGLNPEGIVGLPPRPWTQDTEVQLVSDTGQWVFYDDGLRAKDLPYAGWKKCRMDTVHLGEIVEPRPVFTAIEPTAEGWRLSWRAPPAAHITLETAPRLEADAWSALPGTPSRQGAFFVLTVPPAPDRTRFFRLRRTDLP